MLLPNNPELDAEQLERKLSQLSEYRRRTGTGSAPLQPALHFEQEANHAIVTLAALAALAALAPAAEPETATIVEPLNAPSAPAAASPATPAPEPANFVAIEAPQFAAAPSDSSIIRPEVTTMPPSSDPAPSTVRGASPLRRRLKSILAWFGNLRHLNSRLFDLNAELHSLQVQIGELEKLRANITALETLPARIAALERLPARIDELEKLPARIDELEKLPARIDELEKLPAQFSHLTTSTNALHESNRGVFLRLDMQDLTNQGVQDRIAWLEALKLGARLSQLDQTNIANRLNRLDVLDISNRLNAWDMTNVANRLHRLDEYRIGERLEHLDAMLKTVLERNLERDNRIAALVQKFRSAPAAPQASAPTAAPALAAHADIDQFYVEFEGLFRGAPEQIRERLKVYLPYVAALADDPSALVVDIGCGRGEWLGLLQEQGVRALGIDMNAAMVALCRERGLEAECTDAIAWLQAQPAGSVALISGFHLIEHLPFETLLALFDAALHALRPDGMLIFETPNPENLVVGACHFYYDPTHRNPIVPAVAEFMARQRGFARAEILRVNAYPDSYLLDEDSEVAIRINRAFYGAQDFAVLAWKTHAA